MAKSFSNLIINKNSEIILFYYKTIFQLSKWEYLIVISVDDFVIRFKDEDKELITILLIKDLDKIQIYEKDNKEFIYIYKKIESKNLNNSLDSFSFFKKKDSKRSLFRRGRRINYSYDDNYY